VKSGRDGATERAYNKRPKRLSGATYKMNTPLGKAYITINDVDHAPFEVIVNVGKAGSDVFAMSEALGRVSTLFLRFGELPDVNKARLLIKHLKGIGGSGAVGFGANRVESIPDAVAKALEMHLDGEDEHQAVAATSSYSITSAPDKEEVHHDVYGDADHKDFCPSCGSATLLHAEGCKTCTTCGFSKCS